MPFVHNFFRAGYHASWSFPIDGAQDDIFEESTTAGLPGNATSQASSSPAVTAQANILPAAATPAPMTVATAPKRPLTSGDRTQAKTNFVAKKMASSLRKTRKHSSTSLHLQAHKVVLKTASNSVNRTPRSSAPTSRGTSTHSTHKTSSKPVKKGTKTSVIASIRLELKLLSQKLKSLTAQLSKLEMHIKADKH